MRVLVQYTCTVKPMNNSYKGNHIYQVAINSGSGRDGGLVVSVLDS